MPQDDTLFERLVEMTKLLSTEQMTDLRRARDAGEVPSLSEGAQSLGLLDEDEIDALNTLARSISLRRSLVPEIPLDEDEAQALREERERIAEAERRKSAVLNPVLTESVASLPSFREHPKTLGEYALLERLARSTHGIVLKARRSRDGLMVALKVLPLTMVNDESQITRFQREVETVRKLNHPNIVTIYDHGANDDHIYYAMELLKGPSVREMIDERSRIPHFEAAEYALDAARGLGYAHEHGIIHRDVKPSNLVLSEEGRIKVVDFGVAYEKAQSLTLTRTGLAPGTPAFMAPEQIQGDADLDERCDVYSLGVTLYEMLSGARPFIGKSQYETMRAVLFAPVVRLQDLMPHLPREICDITHRAMAKPVDERYPTMSQFAAELDRFLAMSE